MTAALEMIGVFAINIPLGFYYPDWFIAQKMKKFLIFLPDRSGI